jgi:excisionase family DNA binding protein
MSITESHERIALVTKDVAMEQLQVSLRTVDRYIADGKLTAVRLTPRTTRITQESLDALSSPPAEAPVAAPNGDGPEDELPLAGSSASPSAGVGDVETSTPAHPTDAVA